MHIKNIIFDLGGVIINIYPERSLQAFSQYAEGLGDSSVYRQLLFHEFETGKIHADEFRERVRVQLNLNITNAQIDDCMIAMLGDVPSERIQTLERVHKKYFTALLSNTNAIHYDAVAGYIGKRYSNLPFNNYFHKAYFSHLVGLRKPDTRIYELVLRENNLVPEETLFLDDLGENLKAARSLGIQTIKVTPENGIVDILSDF
ncbi:MAG: HAD family phosphatase [Chitinophagales bacterium]|nr:HAD family phosphatase [Chitinophagales bacterium]